jgi:hypothetical protein
MLHGAVARRLAAAALGQGVTRRCLSGILLGQPTLCACSHKDLKSISTQSLLEHSS